jgi:hypothetical protein
MRSRVIYDPGEPVAIRAYKVEALAVLDQRLLEACGIPAFVREVLAEARGPAALVVRREHVAEALEILDAGTPDDAPYDPPDDAPPEEFDAPDED